MIEFRILCLFVGEAGFEVFVEAVFFQFSNACRSSEDFVSFEC